MVRRVQCSSVKLKTRCAFIGAETILPQRWGRYLSIADVLHERYTHVRLAWEMGIGICINQLDDTQGPQAIGSWTCCRLARGGWQTIGRIRATLGLT